MFWRILSIILLVNVTGLSPTFSSDPPKPVGLLVTLRAEPPKAVYYRGDELLFRVTLSNRSDRELVVCVEDWEEPVGMLALQVTNSAGKTVNRIAGLEVFDALDDDVLESLPSGGSLSGLANLGVYERVYDFSKGSYLIRAVYFCPFRGTTKIEGRTIPIISGEVVSEPAVIHVDYLTERPSERSSESKD